MSSQKPTAPDVHSLYQDLVETSQDLIWQCDNEGRYTYLNPAWEDTLGYAINQMLGKKFSEFQSSEYAKRDQSEFARLLAGGTVKGYETIHRSKSGRDVYLVFNAKRVLDVEGRSIGARGTAYNITPYKEALEQLRESEERYRRAFDTSPDSININAMDGTYVDINEGFTKLTGYSRPEVIGLSSEAINIWAHAGDRKKLIDGLQAHGRVENLEADFRLKDGTVKTGLMSACIIPLQNKPHILSITRDISERQRSEKEIFDSADRYRMLIEFAVDAFFQGDALGNFIDVNTSASELTGYTREELLQMNMRDLFPADVLSSMPLRYDVLDSAQKIIAARDIIQRDGTRRFVEMHSKKMPDGTYQSFMRDNTERKQTEEALREKDLVFQSLMDNSPVYVFFKDHNIKAIHLSKNYEQMLGMPLPDMLGKDMNDLFPSDLAKDMIAVDQRILREGKLVQVDEELNGRYYTTIKFPIQREAGHPMLAGFTIDITERKKVELALQENEARLKAFMDFVPALILIKDHQLRPLYANDNMREVFPVDDWIGKTPAELFPPDVADAMAAKDWEAFETGYTSYEEEWLDKNGGQRVFYTQKFRIAVPEGPPLLGAIITDITERKHAQEAVAAERERLSVTLRSIGDGVITTDTKGNVVIMNRVAEQLTGWTQQESAGKPLSSVFTIVDETTREACENPAAKVLSNGLIVELTGNTILISRDEVERLIADSAAPIKDKNSNTIGVVLVFRDMTEKRKLLEASQNNQKLESLGILAGGIAHDFNNLLGGIFGYLDLAQSKSTDITITRYLEKAVGTIHRARGLTQQLLTFAKGGAPARATGRLFPFVQEAAQFALSGSSVSCHFDVPEDLWACNFDRNQIGQVIDNIVINAQQAMPMGGVIEISARNVLVREFERAALAKGAYVKISITDRGIGIPREILSRIFDPFFTTKTKGHGLGLATCFSIIRRHDGEITVESESGHGSTFHIYLPASSESLVPEKSDASPILTGTGMILVMDDEAIIRNTIEAMLQSLGYSVVTMKDGREVLEFFAGQRHPAAMILDLTIPGGMGGRETILEIRKRDMALPVIVSSGYAEDPVMSNPAAFGFTASLRKPFMLSELAAVLKKHMAPLDQS